MRSLNTRHEENLILTALSDAKLSDLVQVEFAPNSSLETIATFLEDVNPHILHFVGHGSFAESADTGFVLMEDPSGQQLQVPNRDFVLLLQQHARALRFLFLSACQSAVNSRNNAYADLAPRLLQVGIPAMVAMQFSVLNQSAMHFGSTLYKAISSGKSLFEAMTTARGLLSRSGVNTVDFATPVLYLSDPSCLRVDLSQDKAHVTHDTVTDLTGLSRVQQFVGRNSDLRELQTGLDPQHGHWRAAIIYGLGGMGKTVLATRLADRMSSRFIGIKSIRMTPTTTAQSIMDQLHGFLLRLSARFNSAQLTKIISEFTALKNQPLPLEVKASVLIELLSRLPLLIIFDNYEDVLPASFAVSRAASNVSSSNNDTKKSNTDSQPAPAVDPELSKLISLLLEGVSGPSRFIFTSRADFAPLEVGRLTGAVHHHSLGEMPFRDVVYLMDTLPTLANVPIAVHTERKPLASQSLTAVGKPNPHTKRNLYTKLGGHPYTITLFAEHVSRSSLDEVLDDLSGVQKELIDFTLLDKAAATLTERASTLLKSAAIYDEPVPMRGLAYMLGNEQDATPDVEEEVSSLRSWGLISIPPGRDNTYSTHALVRDWALKDTTT